MAGKGAAFAAGKDESFFWDSADLELASYELATKAPAESNLSGQLRDIGFSCDSAEEILFDAAPRGLPKMDVEEGSGC